MNDIVWNESAGRSDGSARPGSRRDLRAWSHGEVLTVFGRSDSSTCAETRGQYSQGGQCAMCITADCHDSTVVKDTK